MMMHEDQTASMLPMGNFQAKPGEPVYEFNSQGERIEVRPAEAVSVVPPAVEVQEAVEEEEDFVELWDTPLAIPADAFWPATDDTNLVHEVISCGHVLKSTHDLARWSEKTGARRVNSEEAIDAITDLAVNLETTRPVANKTQAANGWRGRQKKQQKSEVVNAWPVLKSTHDSATWSEKKGAHAVNPSNVSQMLEVVQNGSNQRNWRANRAPAQPSRVVKTWPVVLKSTHDRASRSEKWAVNGAGATGLLDEVVKNGGRGAVQAGGSLQSGIDTQAGSHVQMEGTKKISETPEQVMAELHLHV